MKYIKNIVVIVIALIFAIFASIDFLAMHKAEPIANNANLTEVKMLSEYCSGLKGTDSDTEIYVFDSGKAGGTFLVLGGTHPNESAGLLAAIAMVENIKVTQGRVMIIPWTNKSGFTHTSPLDGMQDNFTLTLADGSTRTFRVGNRLTNPVDQWPDYTYYEGKSGRKLVGTESAEIRNVNRLYYGNEDGVLTEKVCAGIYNLIIQENVSITMDMHEGSPEFLYLDCTMVNQKADNAKAMTIASEMALNMQFDDLDMRAEYSGVTSYGLSHRSLGDNTQSMMTLMETYNPSMGPLHGKMDDDLIINGNEPNYYQAHLDGFIYFDVPEDGYPLIERTARHITCISYFAQAYSDAYPDKAIAFEGLGSYEQMVKAGLENILKPINN
ncbi:MAG: succinylglutamate desuccinylase/aspartoacylase family protein [Sphaerochaetaceae bacterium]|nr:succinylglutamate desuccinylase/aspartoacylase family protein [Sphaerochaetaceae bacterium]